MTETRVHAYEGMFLFSQGASARMNEVVEHLNAILGRGDAEVIAMRKWDERRLAYEIKKQRRGLYLLVYFKAPTEGLGEIERQCNLSEEVVRQLILRVDHLTEDQMRAMDARTELKAESNLRSEDGDAGAEKPEPVEAGSESSE